VVPGASYEVTLAPIAIEFTVMANFTVGRSPASTVQQQVLTGRPPSARMAFYGR
jgi:hypothetical protein